jgi:uncharacterized surface protein with fasciclin (FAS1) repeats
MIQKTRKAILAFLYLTFAVGSENYDNAVASNASAENTVRVIPSFGNFTTLAKGLDEARRKSTPEGPGPYTVFYPATRHSLRC